MQKAEEHLIETLVPPRNKPSQAAELSTKLSLVILWHPDHKLIGLQSPCSFTSGKILQINRFKPLFSSAENLEDTPLSDKRVSRSSIIIENLGKDNFQITPPESPMEVKVNGTFSRHSQTASLDDKNDLICITISNSIILGLCHLPCKQFRSSSNSLKGISVPINHSRQLIERYAATDLPVMLIGETGTGKELAATDLHQNSLRSSKPFVSVNMAAIPDELAVSELFGSKKGAYTGSVNDQPGFFNEADHGTLFCDEIGDTPASVQPMLLRAIETGFVRPLGNDSDVKTDTRIITATDRPINEVGSSVQFSKPLYHRLSATQITMPTLKSRKVDIPLLLLHFLLESPLNEQKATDVSTDFLLTLVNYEWPGNVRELKNIANQILLGEQPKLERIDTKNKKNSKKRSPYRSHRSITEKELLAALDNNCWQIKPAAAELLISRTSCYELIKNCGAIRRPKDIHADEIQEALKKYPKDIGSMCSTLRTTQSALRNYLNNKDFH